MTSGTPLIEVQKDGVRIVMLVLPHDRARHSIGAPGLMYPDHHGEDQASFLKRSTRSATSHPKNSDRTILVLIHQTGTGT